MRMIYTRNDIRNKIFGYAISHLNFDQNAVNYSEETNKRNSLQYQVKFCRLLNDDETEEFNQI